MPDKHQHIKDFIKSTKDKFGSIPKFIHTTADNKVNYSGPYFDDEEIEEMLDSVLFGTWLAAGDKVHQFEEAFSEKFNHKSSVMVNSGSSANLLMIAAIKKYLKWDDGDEVILSVVGFPTTLSPLMVNNLTPVFVDIEWDTLNFDIDLIEEKITDKTKAIFISPVLGNPPDMDRLLMLSGKHNIDLIMDNCDSLGSKWRGVHLTEFSSVASCSFYPAHHITTGEGGMISSNVPGIIKIARGMSAWGRACTCVGTDNLLPNGSCGRRFSKWLPGQDIVMDHRYVFGELGYNLKPLDLQGGLGLAQLKKFDEIVHLRRFHKNFIANSLSEWVPEVRTLYELERAETSWFGVPVICPDKRFKVKFVKFLEDNNIQTRNYFAGNILLHDAYKHLGNWEDYPEANKVLERVLFLGCSPNYTMDTLSYIDKTLQSWKQ